MEKLPVEAGAGVSSCRVLQGYRNAKRVPAFFTCTSGELLWGQVHTVIEGSTAGEVDTALGPHEVAVPSGTVFTCAFRFRVSARKGAWKVEAAFVDSFQAGSPPRHVGFVCHHVDVDGLEILKRAAELGYGVGRTGTFGDLQIVYVNRYDWSGLHTPGHELIVDTIEGKAENPKKDFDDDDDMYYGSLLLGRFLLVDAGGFANLIQALKDGEKLERKNYVLRNKYNGSNFGAHLVVEQSEYELGWMVFQNGEMVGFVYDGAYSALEGNNLRIGSAK